MSHLKWFLLVFLNTSKYDLEIVPINSTRYLYSASNGLCVYVYYEQQNRSVDYNAVFCVLFLKILCLCGK